MKKIYLFTVSALFFITNSFAQKTEYKVDAIFPITSTATYTSPQTASGLTISPGTASDVTIYRTSNSKKTDDGKYTGARNLIRLTSAGLPTSGTTIPTQRFASIEVTGDCSITVYGMAGNAGQESTLIISDGTNMLGTLTSDKSTDTLYGTTVSYTGEGGTIYFYVEDGRYANFYIGIIVVDAPVVTGDVLVVEDFESKTIGDTYDMKAYYDTEGTAIVTANPANASQKSVHITASNWDTMLKLNIVLPDGKTLADYETFSFDIYIGPNANDENAIYKNMFVYLNDVAKYADEGYPKQAELSAWTTKSYSLSGMNLSDDEKALTSFALAFGISTNKGDYYIDNVKLTEKAGTSEPQEGYFIIDNFNDKTTGSALQVKTTHSETDATASVASDPANASNKAANIVTTDYNAFLKLDVTLPAGKTLSDYESLLFDIYIGPIANDEYPGHKKMFIYIDDVQKYADDGYPQQTELSVWTTKTYTFDVLALTDDEKAKNAFTLALGISTDKGNYFIDNVRLKEIKGTVGEKTILAETFIYYLNNTIYIESGKSANIQLYDMNGRLILSEQAVSMVDVSALPSGLYIVKASVDGQNQLLKFMR